MAPGAGPGDNRAVLIMGYGPRKPKDLGPVAPALCPNCGNHVVFRLLELRNWFSVFFVPLVPGRAHHVLACPVCDYGVELDERAARLAEQLAEAAARGASTDDPEHRRAVDQLWASLGGRRLADPHDARPAGGTGPTGFDAPPPDPSTAGPPPPAGWYPDPFGESEQRYWDGTRWTAGTNPPRFRR